MKTRTLIFGVIVAALGIISLSTANAQNSNLPPVKIVPAEKNMIKLIYDNPSDQVEIKFSDRNGLIKKDKVESASFEQGFAKKYKVQRNSDDAFWVEVDSPSMTVTYKITSTRKGLWSAELENTTYHPVVASR